MDRIVFDRRLAAATVALLQRLAAHGLPVASAIWLHLPEVPHWRFVITSPLVRTGGPRSAYGMLRAALQNFGAAFPISILETHLLDIDDPRMGKAINGLSECGRVVALADAMFNGLTVSHAIAFKLPEGAEADYDTVVAE